MTELVERKLKKHLLAAPASRGSRTTWRLRRAGFITHVVSRGRQRVPAQLKRRPGSVSSGMARQENACNRSPGDFQGARCDGCHTYIHNM